MHRTFAERGLHGVLSPIFEDTVHQVIPSVSHLLELRGTSGSGSQVTSSFYLLHYFALSHFALSCTCCRTCRLQGDAPAGLDYATQTDIHCTSEHCSPHNGQHPQQSCLASASYTSGIFYLCKHKPHGGVLNPICSCTSI